MKLKILFISLFICASSIAQNEKISTIETIEILNNNHKEANFYYKSNWKNLRVKAVDKDYIHSFQLLKTTYSEDTPFHLILVTTYKNAEQYKNREKHFAELIKQAGKLKLLNDLEPSQFRKSVFTVEGTERLE